MTTTTLSFRAASPSPASAAAPLLAMLAAACGYAQVAQGEQDGLSEGRRREAARALAVAVAALPELRMSQGATPAPGCASALSLRFPRAELELLHGEVRAISSSTAPGVPATERLQDLALRARSVRFLHPAMRRRVGRFVQALTAAAARAGLHVHGLRRRDDGRADVVVVSAPSAAPKTVAVSDRRAANDARPGRSSVSAAACETFVPASLVRERTAEVPLLRALGQERPIVIVGGLARRDVLSRIAETTGLDLEWLETHSHGVRPTDALAQRVRGGQVAALVLLHGLVAHRHTTPLLAAARAVDVPVAYAGKGSASKVLHALVQIEGQLSARRSGRIAA